MAKFLLKNGKTKSFKHDFHLGDIVKVTCCGFRYEYYDNAFYTMNGGVLGKYATNVSHNSSFRFSLEYKNPKTSDKWIIIGKCLHEHSEDIHDIIYLLFNVRKRHMLMIGMDGIQKVSHSMRAIDENEFRFFQVGAR